MVYENCRIFGPYKRKDQRQHVVIIFEDNRRKTVSYPKYLYEVHHDIYLKPNETIDHIDNDFENNDISNLQILERRYHCYLDAIRKESQRIICQSCGCEFIIDSNRLSEAIFSKKIGCSGPYCSKSCAGKAKENHLNVLGEIKYHSIKGKRGMEKSEDSFDLKSNAERHTGSNPVTPIEKER